MTNASNQAAAQEVQELYRLLPSVNELLFMPACRMLLENYPRARVLGATRATLAGLLEEIASGRHSTESLHHALSMLGELIANQISSPPVYSLRPVINATGVILHTNLGRAPLSQAALDRIAEVAGDYCNLEFDLQNGERSRRDVHVESVLLRALNISDAELYGAVVVNNCAAATFLALNALAEKQEVIVSRGELVEIGGGFRIPEILEKSGAVLKEVGTTNRTRLSDYENALSPATALILRVHQSNFSIEGFTERPALADLVALARRAGVPLFEDQGTGLLASLDPHGIAGETTLTNSIGQGVDLVASSGDKLMGGPQCGVLAGRTELLKRIKSNPLLRAFRVDKLTYAALEATLIEYVSGSYESLPIHRMLALRPEELMRRCRQIAQEVHVTPLSVDVVPVESLVGGGTAPKVTLRSCALSLRHASLPAKELCASLRHCDPPVIGRVSEDCVLLDLRTVHPRFDAHVVAALHQL